MFLILASYKFFPLQYWEIITKNTRTSDPFVIEALIFTESSFREKAISPKGAMGLMQLMPDTIDWLYSKGYEIDDPFDPESNISLGVYYFEYLLKKFNYDYKAAIISYNTGPYADSSVKNLHGKLYYNKVVRLSWLYKFLYKK